MILRQSANARQNGKEPRNFRFLFKIAFGADLLNRKIGIARLSKETNYRKSGDLASSMDGLAAAGLPGWGR